MKKNYVPDRDFSQNMSRCVQKVPRAEPPHPPPTKEKPLPFMQEKSGITPAQLQKQFDLELKDYPFDPIYIGKQNPYTGNVINSEADYWEYLREHAYHILCDKDVKNSHEASLKLRAQITALTKDRNNLDRALRKEQKDRRKGRIAFLVLLAVVVTAAIVLGILAGNAANNAALRKVEAPGYDSGYQDGCKDGKRDGYNSGYAEGYNSGYAEGYNSGYAEGYGNESSRSSTGSSSGSGTRYSSGGDSTGTHRDEPIANTYIGNKSTHKFHKPTCSYLPSKSNQVTFDSRDEALAAGYSPCGHCHP